MNRFRCALPVAWAGLLPPLLLLAGCPTTDPLDDDDTTAGDDDDATGDDDTVDPEPPWPEWAFHHWVWEDESTQDSLLEMVDGYAEHDILVGAVIIDSPWETGYNTMEWDTDLFPDPQGLIDELHARDIRVMMWITPAINIDVEPLYSDAAAAGYFMQASEDSGPAVVDWWKGDGSLVDYFNPEAVEWWHGLMDPMLAMGIDGWKCDGLDFAAIIADYSPGAGREVERLEYSHAYYRDFHDYTREALGDDRVNTARPVDNYGADIGGDAVAFAPVDINWAGWVGDQDSDWIGLQAALRNMYWSADYGYVAFGSDIGGYREDGSELGREKEAFLRWAQMGAFCPIMENGGGGAHWPWLFDEETVAIYKTYTDLHHELLPYLMAEGARAFDAGTSLMTFTGSATYDYTLGPDIFVAPMIEAGTQREVSFPVDGDWTWLFGSGETFTGGTTEELEVPLDSFPAFVRVGSDISGTIRQ